MTPEGLRSEHDAEAFKEKRTKYFQQFTLRHLPEMREQRRYGLLLEEGSEGWRNVVRHEVLSAVMTETLSELLGRTQEETERITHFSLIHDVDKRRQQDSKSKNEIWLDELGKTEQPLVGTGSNFTDFENWSDETRLLRFVDSSIGEESGAHWYGPRDPKNLPPVIIIPWRDRINGFKENKREEGEKGIELYGMTTWDKLEEVMTTIEHDFYTRIIEAHPDLAEKYPQENQLAALIEDQIHEKILNS